MPFDSTQALDLTPRAGDTLSDRTRQDLGADIFEDMKNSFSASPRDKSSGANQGFLDTSMGDLFGSVDFGLSGDDLLSKVSRKKAVPAPERSPEEFDRSPSGPRTERIEPQDARKRAPSEFEENLKRDPSGRVTEITNERGKTEVFRDENGEIGAINTPDGERFVKVDGQFFEQRSDPGLTRPRDREFGVGQDGTVTTKGKIGSDFEFTEVQRPDGSRIQETQDNGRDGKSASFEFGKDGNAQRIVVVSADGNAEETTFE